MALHLGQTDVGWLARLCSCTASPLNETHHQYFMWYQCSRIFCLWTLLHEWLFVPHGPISRSASTFYMWLRQAVCKMEAGNSQIHEHLAFKNFLKATARICNMENLFLFNYISCDNYFSMYLNVFCGHEVCIPYKLYNMMVHQRLFDENHIIGKPIDSFEASYSQFYLQVNLIVPQMTCSVLTSAG